ncbi:MAG: hypothetical protein ACOCX3_01475 [Chloroflexota bacterium]
MAWWIHLTNQAIQYMDIVEAEQPMLAVWSRWDRVAYYDLATGAAHGEDQLVPAGTHDRSSADWQLFVGDLKAPNGAYLPVLRMPEVEVHLTDDGRMRMYLTGAAQLLLDNDGTELELELRDVTSILALALDRFLGLSAVLDQDGKLHLFQQHIRVGTFDIGLKIHPELRSHLAISRGGSLVFASDGQQIVVTDSGGAVLKTLDTHYFIRQMSCSPDGRYLVTNDMDTGVIRVYDALELVPTHQRFAIDLVAEATQVQLLADLPPTFVAPSTLASDNAGRIAFSMSGVICVTDLTFMDELPRPQALL